MFVVSKHVIQDGQGFHCPMLTSQCQFVLKLEEPVDHKDISFSVNFGNMSSFCISSPKTYFDAVLIECLSTMKESEKSTFVVDFIKSDFEERTCLKLSIHLVSFTKGCHVWDVGPVERMEIALKWKALANDCFSKSKVCMAGYWYHKTIFLLISGRHEDKKQGGGDVEDLEKVLSTCRLNLASVQLQRQLFDHVISNCSIVLSRDQHNVKALYRRAQAFQSRHDTKSAISDLKSALKIAPNSLTVRNFIGKISG